MRLITIILALALLASSVSFAQKGGRRSEALFDGKTLNGWKQLTGQADYKVENGAIVGTAVANSPNSFLVTEKEYGDFVLELLIKVEDSTNNTGMQVRSHFDPTKNNGNGLVFGYQVDVDPSSRRWTGGIYDEGRREWLYPLMLNQGAQNAFKLGEYNHVRIECIGREIKTWINRQPTAYVVDSVDSRGFIALQVHSIGNPEHAGRRVYWKDIRIETDNPKSRPFPDDIYVVNNIPNSLVDFEKKAGWKLLFDGVSTKGWSGAYKPTFPEKGWQISNGELRVMPAAGGEAANGGDIVTVDKYNAFDFSFEFKLAPGANSGVKYFVTLSENNTGSAIGLEYQLLDDTLHADAKMGRDGNRTLASLYDMIKAEKTKRFIRQPGGWNTGRIVVYPNNHVEHYLNGIKVLEYERGSKAFRDLVAISKYVVWKNFGEAPEGRILLQDHGNEVSFRSLKIKKL